MLKNNPKKFDINVKYNMLCGEPNDTYSDGGTANQVVYGYMQLLREGHDISRLSTKQALGREPIASRQSIGRVVKFNFFNGSLVGKFNCSNGDFIVTGGNDIGDLPVGRWLSRQDVVELNEDLYDSAGNFVASAEDIGNMSYEGIADFVTCN